MVLKVLLRVLVTPIISEFCRISTSGRPSGNFLCCGWSDYHLEKVVWVGRDVPTWLAFGGWLEAKLTPLGSCPPGLPGTKCGLFVLLAPAGMESVGIQRFAALPVKVAGQNWLFLPRNAAVPPGLTSGSSVDWNSSGRS